MIQVLSALFVFGLVVIVHELGHFVAAKKLGMRVSEFGIGFGPKLFSFQKGETLYSLRAIPLGGFNKIDGMDPDEELNERSFVNQPILHRVIVIAAGSLMNLLLPVVLIFLLYVGIGIEQPVLDKAVIGTVMVDRPAAKAGLQDNDQVLAVNGVPVTNWVEMVQNIQTTPQSTPVTLQVERNGQKQELTIAADWDEKAQKTTIGVMAKTTVVRTGIIEGAKLSVEKTVGIITGTASALYQMVTGKIDAELSGPIGVARMAGEVASTSGWVGLLSFAAFLSVNLGMMNLLPIPALDGGHLLILLAEAVRGKPLNSKQVQRIQSFGIALLLTLFLWVTFQDIFKIFN